MKTRTLIIQAALAATIAVTAQVVIDSQTAIVEKSRGRSETIFRTSVETGDLESIEIRTWDITKINGVEIRRDPGQTIIRTPAQLAATLPGFSEMAAAFGAVANQMMTNAP